MRGRYMCGTVYVERNTHRKVEWELRRGLRSGEQTQWIVFMSLLFSSGAMNENGMLSIMACYFF